MESIYKGTHGAELNSQPSTLIEERTVNQVSKSSFQGIQECFINDGEEIQIQKHQKESKDTKYISNNPRISIL